MYGSDSSTKSFVVAGYGRYLTCNISIIAIGANNNGKRKPKTAVGMNMTIALILRVSPLDRSLSLFLCLFLSLSHFLAVYTREKFSANAFVIHTRCAGLNRGFI